MINVIGLGYIGLPTSLILASKGNEVIGTDINFELVKKLNKGEVTFEENGLQELYNVAVENNIQFKNDYETNADVYIVTVPTPYLSQNHKIDTSYLEDAINTIGKVCKDDSIVVIESTISPGTTDKIVRPLIKKFTKSVHLVHAPERILPGSMIDELVNNARTIGADNLEVGERVKSIYKTFCAAPITITDINTAEMTKVVENTYRDINIAFSNELNQICKKANLDVHEVIKIANQHPRVNILSPGPGVGGHCIPVDPWFLISDYPKETNLIKKARLINQNMPKIVLEQLKNIMKENKISDFNEVGIYGITYKENVDDIRESPTLQLYNIFVEEGINLPVFYDPFLKEKVIEKQIINEKDFINKIKILVIMVNHSQLQEFDIQEDIIVFDTKNTNQFNRNIKYVL